MSSLIKQNVVPAMDLLDVVCLLVFLLLGSSLQYFQFFKSEKFFFINQHNTFEIQY